jgi:hypothetical protein
MPGTVNPVSDIPVRLVMPLTIKRQLRTTAAANGSNRIALRCPPSSSINALTCLDDLY